MVIRKADGKEKVIRSVLLDEAKETYRKDMKKGAVCPCCGRYGKLNKIYLCSQLVKALIWIASSGKDTPHHWVDVQSKAPREIIEARVYMRLAYWGMIQRKPHIVTGKQIGRAHV